MAAVILKDFLPIAIAPETPLLTKCGLGLIAFAITSYALPPHQPYRMRRAAQWTFALVSIVVVLHVIMSSGYLPVTNRVYEYTQRSGELAIVLGFIFGLVARTRAYRRVRINSEVGPP